MGFGYIWSILLWLNCYFGVYGWLYMLLLLFGMTYDCIIKLEWLKTPSRGENSLLKWCRFSLGRVRPTRGRFWPTDPSSRPTLYEVFDRLGRSTRLGKTDHYEMFDQPHTMMKYDRPGMVKYDRPGMVKYDRPGMVKCSTDRGDNTDRPG